MQYRIAEAAIEEIKLRGLKFTIRDVAARLGISTKTLYQHFESKTDIISFLIEQAIEEMQQSELQMMKDTSLSLVQKIEQALLILPSAVAFIDIRALDELKKMYPLQWEKVNAYIQQGWDNIRLMVDQAIQQQLIRPFNMELLIQVYIGALYQLINHRASEDSRMSLTETLRGMVNMLMYGIVEIESELKSH